MRSVCEKCKLREMCGLWEIISRGDYDEEVENLIKTDIADGMVDKRFLGKIPRVAIIVVECPLFE